MSSNRKLDSSYHIGAVRRRRKSLVIALIIVLLLLFCTTFFFTIRTVEVAGNQAVSTEEIMEEVGVEEGMNMFAFVIPGLFHKTEVNPLLASIDVFIGWPGTVRIQVTERSVVGYVAHMGLYLCIDDAGYVVDSTHSLKEDMPVITGVAIDSFKLGEKLNPNSAAMTQIVMDLCSSLKNYGLSQKIIRVDLTDADDIRLYTRTLEARIGNDENLALKVQALQLILQDSPQLAGILHLEDINGQVYLEKTV